MNITDYISIVVSVIAVFISIGSLWYSRQRVLLEQRKYAELLDEKARCRFDISIDETIKQDVFLHESCIIWAVKFIVANRTDEPVFLDELGVELGFRLRHPSTKQFLRELLWPSEKQAFGLRFQFPALLLNFVGSRTTFPPVQLMSDCYDAIHQSTHLVNWETRQSIRFVRRHWHRGPALGEKEIWMLFGKIPLQLSKHSIQHDLYLATVKCHFHTDRGVMTVSGQFGLGQSVSDTFIAELDQLAAAIAADTTVVTTD